MNARRTWLWLTMLASFAAYLAKLLRILRGLDALKTGTNTREHTMSVIIPARDEEVYIRRCLEGLNRQTYPKHFFEIIVVNDRSSDRTAEIVNQMRAENPRIRLVSIEEVPPGVAPKKHAIATGIRHALGEIIVTTDADCVHRPEWLAALNREFEPDVGVVIGHVYYRPPKTWFEGIQAIDYLSYRILSAGAVGIGEALSATGSNFAYRRRVFDEVGGFGDSEGMVSGDDDLFLHRVHRYTSWRITAATAPETFVMTEPVENWRAFLRQRARWASKVTSYQPRVKPFLTVTFLLLLLMALTLPMAFIHPRKWAAFWPLLLAKWTTDYAVMRRGARVFGQEELLRYFWAAEPLNPYYVIIAVLWGIFGKFTWKGDRFGRKVASGGRA